MSSSTSTTTLVFPHPVLTPITDKPDVATVKLLKREVYANARAIPSTAGGGINGHLGLVMANATYVARAGVPFDPPVHPGPLPVHAAGATNAQISAANRQYDDALAKHALYHQVLEEIRKQILEAVPDVYLPPGDPKSGYEDISPLDMITHLTDTYGAMSQTIIYIPSVCTFPKEKEIARLLACSLNTLRKEADPTSDVGEVEYSAADTAVRYGEDGKWQSDKYTLQLKEKRRDILSNGTVREVITSRPLVDLYWLDYHKILIGENVNPIVQLLLYLGLSIAVVARIDMLLFGELFGWKTGIHWWQLAKLLFLFPTVFIISAIVYGLWAYASINAVMRLEMIDLGENTEAWIATALLSLPLLAGIFLKTEWIDFTRDMISQFNGGIKCYLMPWGDGVRGQLRIQVQQLLERIQNQHSDKENPYDQIHIVAHSFGTLISIDTFFPEERPTATDALPRLRHLVTLASPFDMVRSLRPGLYGNGERRRLVNNLIWTNIFIPQDIMGSNFRNDSSANEEPEIGIPTDGSDIVPEPSVPVFPTLNGLGFSSYVLAKLVTHHLYIHSGGDADNESTHKVVKALFGGDDRHWICNWHDATV